jgi:hypothetical protein
MAQLLEEAVEVVESVQILCQLTQNHYFHGLGHHRWQQGQGWQLAEYLCL